MSSRRRQPMWATEDVCLMSLGVAGHTLLIAAAVALGTGSPLTSGVLMAASVATWAVVILLSLVSLVRMRRSRTRSDYTMVMYEAPGRGSEW